MTSYTGEYLSKIIARQFVEPQDRSQYLPFATPIYCPNYNGVRADGVEIINPNVSTYFPTSDGKNIYIGVDPNPTDDVTLNEDVTAVGKPDINVGFNNAITATGFNYDAGEEIDIGYKVDSSVNGDDSVYKYVFEIDDITTRQVIVDNGDYPGLVLNIATGEDSETYPELVIPYTDDSVLTQAQICEKEDVVEGFKYTVVITMSATGFSYKATTPSGDVEDEVTFDDFSGATAGDIKIGDDTVNPATSLKLYLNESSINGDTLATLASKSKNQPININNVLKVDINKKFTANYVVPHEVDLKAEINTVDVIKADMAVKFKKAVSDEIIKQIDALIEADDGGFTKVTEGDTQAETIGLLIANFIANGTGQEFSIVKYSNGAPVSKVLKSSNQSNIDRTIAENSEYSYDIVDDVNIPALRYIERPTLLLSNDNFVSYCQNLVARVVDTYVEDKLIVDTAYNYNDKGICGSNDVFAVAFTEPKIVRSPRTDIFADNITIEVDYGVKLVNPKNLFLVF